MPGQVGQAYGFLRQALARHEQSSGLRVMIRAKPSRQIGGHVGRELPQARLGRALPEHRAVKSSRRPDRR